MPKGKQENTGIFSMKICSRSTKKIIVNAFEEALQRHNTWIEPEHFLLGILRLGDTKVFDLLKRKDIDLVHLEKSITDGLPEGTSEEISELPFSKRSMKMLSLAIKEFKSSGDKKLMPVHIITVLLKKRPKILTNIW